MGIVGIFTGIIEATIGILVDQAPELERLYGHIDMAAAYEHLSNVLQRARLLVDNRRVQLVQLIESNDKRIDDAEKRIEQSPANAGDGEKKS